MAKLPKDLSNPRELAIYTKDSWQGLDGFYKSHFRRWRRVADFIRSIHWLVRDARDPDRDTETILTAFEGRKRRYPVVNITLAFYREFLTQFLQSRVRFSAVPASPDPEDVAVAELADRVLTALWDITDLESKRVDLAAWLITTGNADLRVYWNEDTGNLVPEVAVGPDGNPVPTGQMLDAGEVAVEVVPPTLCRYPLDYPGSVMVGIPYSYDQAVVRFGEEVAERLSYSELTTFNTITLEPVSLEKAAMIIEHYLPRSSRFPEGLWWVSSEDMLLEGPSPLPSRFPPVVHFRWIPLPGHPTMGLSPLYEITYTNKLIDRILKRTEEWSQARKTLLVRTVGDGLMKDELLAGDEPVKEVAVPANTAPNVIEVGQTPPEFTALRAEALQTSMFLGGFTAPFIKPKEIPAGETLRPLQQPRLLNEGESIALALLNAKSAWQKLGYILLDFVARFYDDTRAIALVGQDRTYQWLQFRGADLKNANAYIHVDEKPLFTWNRDSRRNAILTLLDSKVASSLFISPDGTPDLDKINAAIEAAGLDFPLDTLDPDVLAARNENNLFPVSQEPIPVNPWDDHAKHLVEHKREAKTLRYRSWSEEAKRNHMNHMAAHEEAIAEAAERQRQSLVEQERLLRTIRSETEATRDVRIALGEYLVELLFDALRKTAGLDKNDNPKKE